MKLDLHTHTTYSDGELTIEENVERARKLGLDGIAITDHDNIDSWKDIDNIDDFLVIKGVELSTFHDNESIHLLGYYLNNNKSYKELDDFLIKMRKERRERIKKIIELLKQFKIELTEKEILAEADGAVGRPHVAKAIMKKYPEREYTKDYIFDNFIGNGKPAYVPTYNLHTIDAIKLLKRNNCIAVIAHPLIIDKYSYTKLLKLNIDGIETFYPYKEKDYKEVLKEAQKHNLLITGGSDFHGPNGSNEIGQEYLREPYSKVLLKKLNKME